MKITPIPLKIGNNSYWTTEVRNEILAVDYNMQLYFSIQTNEWTSSIQLKDNNYVCSPTAIQNLENSPNCIIDEIYDRPHPAKCDVIRHTILGSIWKELQSNNAWMVIIPTPTTIAITCNGERRDVSLNQTCLIQISQNCLIRTKQNILTPKRVETSSVTASFFKTIIPRNFSIPAHLKQESIALVEPVYKSSENINSLLEEENDIDTDLKVTSWNVIHHHSMISSTLTTAIILTLAGISLYIYKRYGSHFCKARTPATEESMSSSHQEEETIALQPLYSTPLDRHIESRQNVHP